MEKLVCPPKFPSLLLKCNLVGDRRETNISQTMRKWFNSAGSLPVAIKIISQKKVNTNFKMARNFEDHFPFLLPKPMGHDGSVTWGRD